MVEILGDGLSGHHVDAIVGQGGAEGGSLAEVGVHQQRDTRRQAEDRLLSAVAKLMPVSVRPMPAAEADRQSLTDDEILASRGGLSTVRDSLWQSWIVRESVRRDTADAQT